MRWTLCSAKAAVAFSGLSEAERHRYTLDTEVTELTYDKSDAAILGTGTSAIVYKGMLGDMPVAVKVGTMLDRCFTGACHHRRGHRLSVCSASSSKGWPNLPARRSALRRFAPNKRSIILFACLRRSTRK